jgi:hypothetical protein
MGKQKTSPGSPGNKGKSAAGKGGKEESSWLHLMFIGTIVLLVIGGMVVASLRPQPTYPGSGGGSPPPALSAPDPTPWEYDAANDRYWNPEHGHWHTGRPPQDRRP